MNDTSDFSGLLRCRDLDAAAATQSANLIVEAFGEIYRRAEIDRQILLASLVQELKIQESELGLGRAFVGAGGTIQGVIASYPAQEQPARQKVSLFHLMSNIDRDAARRLFETLSWHRTQISPVPPDSYYLARFAVADNQRGSGLAGKLLSEYFDMTSSACRTFSMHVRGDNARAIAFYLKNGFKLHSEPGKAYSTMTRNI